MDRVRAFVAKVEPFLARLFKRYVPSIATIPLEQGMTWEPTWKALPTHPLTNKLIAVRETPNEVCMYSHFSLCIPN